MAKMHFTQWHPLWAFELKSTHFVRCGLDKILPCKSSENQEDLKRLLCPRKYADFSGNMQMGREQIFLEPLFEDY